MRERFSFNRVDTTADIVRVLRKLPEPKAREIIKLWLADLDLPPETVQALREEARKQAR
jgi:hypothetical protein